LFLASPVRAVDWPQWHYDAAHTSASPEELAAELHLQWTREYPALKPAWPDQPKMPFDAAYEPVVLGKTMFVGSSLTDSVTALDVETGAEKWRFYTDGPVRFAPAAWDGKLYVAADDGYLYCLDAAKGSLRWKFKGAPGDRHILGNERLISSWPARGAPVVADGTVYFAASIWPFMGIFIHALDAKTGKVIWTNDGDGSIYIKQPHGADSFAGVAPQGSLAVIGDVLLIPGGRSVPACYDRKTGKLLRYQLNENGKRGGGHDVAAVGNVFFNGGAAFELTGEKWLGDFSKQVVLTKSVVYLYQNSLCRAYDLKNAGQKTRTTVDLKGKETKLSKWVMPDLGYCKVPDVETLIKAGSRLYAGSGKQVFAVEFPRDFAKQPTITWQAPIDGVAVRLLAAAGRLFAVTKEGRIYCFGPTKVEPKTHDLPTPPPTSSDDWTQKARTILETTKVRDGYCIAWGIGSGRLVTELARQSGLHIIVIDPDGKKVQKFRDELVEAGLYGRRVAVHTGEPLTFTLPPYIAGLMVSEDPKAAGIELGKAFVQKAYPALHPYGGIACLALPQQKLEDFKAVVSDAELVNAKVRDTEDYVLLSREGSLPGSANWTHEHADAANTRVSKDTLVKAPLGILWFGGPSHDGILPRHGHGPQPQVVDGRLLIEGVDLLRCLDIYTGRILWETRLPGVGAFYNNLAHQPGANAAGTNYISTSDGVYVVYGKSCVRLDLDTGKKTAEFTLPPLAAGKKEPPMWGYINVVDDFLIGGSDPAYDPKLFKPVLLPGLGDDEKKTDGGKPPEVDPITKALATLARGSNDNMSFSRHLAVMDRQTGKVLWTVAAQNGFRHNAICSGGGKLFAIDCPSGSEIRRLKLRGETAKFKPRVLALDLKTGKQLWNADADVFGTWLSYSAKHDVLVEAGRVARDTLFDEPKGMRAYHGTDGHVLWTNKTYTGPAMIHDATILKDGNACDLLTGKPTLRTDPITGKEVEWKWVRNYGCNTPAASEHLLTFRSGAAGYFDLCNDGGTGNLGGFRSSCTNNLIVAGGLLSAPDYTRTCTCSYQNQTSLALIHMPDAEMWTYFGPSIIREAVRKIGVNLGAPGDRKADNGTLWLGYPKVLGSNSPTLPVRITGTKVEWFRHHASQVTGDLPWVAASGVKGLQAIAIARGVDPQIVHGWESLAQAFTNAPVGPTLVPAALGQVGLSSSPRPDKETFAKLEMERTYTVRLHFMEPDGLKPGQRVFSVAVQGKTVLKDFDISKEAGGPNRALVREIKGVSVSKELNLTFSAARGVPVLSGVELLAEGW
jgi:outer membrane protein assembly factor BamB